MNISIRTLRACLRQFNLQMSNAAISRNERVSQKILCKIKKIAESTDFSILELLEQEDNELKNLFQIRQLKKRGRKKNPILSTEQTGD